jgi:hypothetical protein
VATLNGTVTHKPTDRSAPELLHATVGFGTVSDPIELAPIAGPGYAVDANVVDDHAAGTE